MRVKVNEWAYSLVWLCSWFHFQELFVVWYEHQWRSLYMTYIFILYMKEMIIRKQIFLFLHVFCLFPLFPLLCLQIFPFLCLPPWFYFLLLLILLAWPPCFPSVFLLCFILLFFFCFYCLAPSYSLCFLHIFHCSCPFPLGFPAWFPCCCLFFFLLFPFYVRLCWFWII